MEKVLENVVAMMKQHPDGIPIKKLAVFYRKKYHRILTISSLGFDNMVSLVASLDSDLIMDGELVFHKDHHSESQTRSRPATPQKVESLTTSTTTPQVDDPSLCVPPSQAANQIQKNQSPLIPTSALLTNPWLVPNYTPLNVSKPAEKLTQHQLLQRVEEVMKKDPLRHPSMDQRQTSYVQHFGEQFPLLQDMSLYDSREALRSAQDVKRESEKECQQESAVPSMLSDSDFPVLGAAESSKKEQKIKRRVQPQREGGAPVFTKSYHSQLREVHGANMREVKSMEDEPQLTDARRKIKLDVDTVNSLMEDVIRDTASERELVTKEKVMKKDPLRHPSMDQRQTSYGQHFGEQFPLLQDMSLYDSREALKSAQDVKRESEKECQQESAVPSMLSDSDFPVLGAAESSQKEQKIKRRVQPQREDGAPVFTKSYHSQLREVHGANMREVKSMEDEPQLTDARRKIKLDVDAVNSLMEDVIRDIASEGELVTKEKVTSRICKQLQIHSLEAVGIKSHVTPALKNLQYTMREINMFIEGAEAVTSICTLYELGQSLAGLKDKKQYEELNLGPLCKLPLVHRMFKIDSNTKDDDIFQIGTIDILKQLRAFKKQQNMVRVDLAEFMKHLADNYNCDSPYELGIRIHSVGLPIATLNKVSRCEYNIMDQAREVIVKELEEEIHEQLRKLKKKVLEPLRGAGNFSSTGSFDLRRKYATMSATEVVLEVLSNAEELFTHSMALYVKDFLWLMSNNRLAKSLFQLAVCGGSLSAPQDLVPKGKPSKAKGPTKTEDKPLTPLPSEAQVKQYLKDSLSSQNSAFSLANMAALERKLTKHFQAKDFLSLEQGNFLEFLVKHNQILQDALGSIVFVGSDIMGFSGSGFRPTRQDVFDVINQCGDITSTAPTELSAIESVLRSHYRIRDIRELGYGPLHRLVELVQRQRQLDGGGLNTVHYESALFAKHCNSSPEGGSETVGCLGEISKAQAMASLLSCPLLEDLNEWSQWELVFKPLHGPLKEFIERNAAQTGLAALEVRPGLLLRITTHTGDKHFSNAAMTLDDVGTAGHLVSMVVADGIANTPTALLANHMQRYLASAVAEDLSETDEDVSSYGRVTKFLLACLTRIPIRTCQALLQKVFLEPFSAVMGQTKSKQVLITVAQSDPKNMNCLHRLGIVLGITDWVKDYQQKLKPPQSQNGNTHTPPEEQSKSNLRDSESNSMAALNTIEFEILGDSFIESGFISSHLNQSLQQDYDELEVEEDDDEEALYELRVESLANGETSDSSIEAEGGHGEEQLELSVYEKDAASCRSEIKVDPKRAIIEDIRKTEFGIGVELNAEGQKLMQVHQDRLGRSLDRLSTELYSKDTHFVLELIQNADDNSYPSDPRVVPALAFVVTRDCITVLNNETGFQERNIRAICDVGRSTKGKHKCGYIGQKGIGFKSVFKVTNCPEIHSNGFHLRFDKTCGPMGYILPHWAEDERPLDTELEDINQHSWTTKVCLPLRPESIQTRNLFHDIHPSLLLFLHRLRFLAIYNQNEKRLVTMTRNNLSHNILEVEHTDGTVRWLVVKTTLQPKKIKDDVESTELALAFQLESSSTGSDIVCQPQKQPLFAYLPLRSFGFRFIVQGDFDIPSSREDVDRDSSWNQWLRSEIPHLFLQAMDEFSDHPKFNRLNALRQFLLFIPLPDEVLDFFKPVASQIIQLLRGKAFLPTLSSDGRVVYKQPSQVAICQDAVIRNVIGEDELQRHLSLSYLHPTLSKAPPNTLLTHLGVKYLQGSDVSTVTTAMTKELMRVDGLQSDASLRQLARLLVCNFRALEHGYGEPDSIRKTLRDLPIIPLADGRVVVLSEEEVFFPMEEIEETKTSQKKKDQPQTGPLSALYKDVTVVHPTLLCCMEPLENQQVRELLKRIGVHEMEPRNLLEQHIYPTIKSNKWKSKPESVVVSYLVFIKRHSSSIREYTETAVPVLTCRGLLSPANERVHFSEEYGNINLSNKLPGCDWILLSPCYVQTDGDVEGWRELFNNLGVRDGLIIRKERQTLSSKELSTGPWSKESVTWYLNPGQACVIDDYSCEEFHALATAQLHGSILLNQRMALLELLATNWNTGHCYSQYLTAQVVDCDGREFRSTKSSFYHLLCFLEWVPAYRPLEDKQQDRKFLRPNSVYLSSPEITSLLGTHVFYLDLDTSEFSRALGLKQSVTVDVLISYLKKWCVSSEADNQENGPPEDELEGANFTSTVQHIHNVYTYLSMNCPQSSLKELFQHTPAVFVELKRRNGDLCSGRFHHLKEVCWSDPTAMFHRYKQLTNGKDSPFKEPKVLAPFYKPLEGMRDFFIKLLNVDTSPNMNQYISLLELICSSSSIPTSETLQDVSVLYARLAQKCKVQVPGDQEYVPERELNHGYCSTLKGMMSDQRVFPTKDSSWVSLRRKPMIPDSKEFEKVFKHHKIVCLLNLPPAEKKAMHTTQNIEQAHTVPYFDEQDRSLFLEICGIRKLSQCVKTEPQTEDFRPCPSVQGMVRPLVPYIQRFLYHHDELGEIYSELIDNNIGEKFRKLQITQVGKLYIRYQLDVGDDEKVEVQDVNCLLKDNKEFYIQKDHLLSKLEICRELVKLFCKENSHRKELMRFLSGLIISLDDPESLKRFLVKEDIRELPSEEEVWEIPEPPKPDITPERVLSRCYSSRCSPVETPQFAKNDGAQTLICWPPQSSILKTGTSSTARADSGVVEDIMKMWPPPASPKDREPEVDMVHRRSSQSPSISISQNLPLGSSRPEEHPGPQRDYPGQPNPAAAMPTPAECRKSQMAKSDREESLAASIPPPGSPAGATNKKQAPNILVVPDAVVLSSSFQGTAATMENRPPLNLDFPLWNTQYKLEDMDLTCQKSNTVVVSDDVMDNEAIGEWGEQLVNSYFCHLRDSDEPGRPVQVLWCNQTGESGVPFDFKLTFGAEGGERVVYVEVKSTVKKEKSFIHLSANELDFALKKKERYHILIVYSAGDNQNVRLRRIKNLAQRLHTKDLALYLFI